MYILIIPSHVCELCTHMTIYTRVSALAVKDSLLGGLAKTCSYVHAYMRLSSSGRNVSSVVWFTLHKGVPSRFVPLDSGVAGGCHRQT